MPAASLMVPGLGAVTVGGATKAPSRTGAWLSGQESQGTHSGTGTFQNVSSVRFFEGEGMWRQEKKSAEG